MRVTCFSSFTFGYLDRARVLFSSLKRFHPDWDLVALMQSGRIPMAPIVVDSPLAIRATEVFLEHAASLENGRSVRRALRSPLLQFTETGEQSRRIAEMELCLK